MIVNRASLVGVVVRLAIFYWVVFTLVFVGEDIARVPELLTSYLDELIDKVWYLAFTALAVSIAMLLKVLALRELRRDSLKGRSALGLTSSIGRVPTPAKPAKRLSPQQRMPILERDIQEWLVAQGATIDQIIPVPKGRIAMKRWREVCEGTNVSIEQAISAAREELHGLFVASNRTEGEKGPELSPYAALFLAIWDTLGAHAHYPASHRQGGHGRARLFAHSMRVAVRCLFEISPVGGNWTYDGVYSKRRGRVAVRVFENTTKYNLNRADPLIPIVGLAHDLGKIEAYVVSKNGEIKQNKEPRGNTLSDDERGVVHDKIAPRILARMPEFWAMRPQDRSLLAMAVGHYHHPSQFPLDNHGLVIEARAAALMMLLIKADREVSSEESGTVAAAHELTPEDLQEIYETFVRIITEPGRINGVGNPEEDARIRIGQKHEDFIVIKVSALMSLLRQELNLSLADGEHKHDLLNHVLALLKDKGVLYDQHNGADLSLYSPLYRVSLYHSQSMRHITDLVPALLLRIPGVELGEFYHLTHLACNPHTAVVRGVILSHIPRHRVKDPGHLNAEVVRAFGEGDGERDLHAEVEEDAIEAPIPAPVLANSTEQEERGAVESPAPTTSQDSAVEAAVRELVGDEKALKAAARLLAKKGGKKASRGPSLADLGEGNVAATEAAEAFAESWTVPTRPRKSVKERRPTGDAAESSNPARQDKGAENESARGAFEPPWLYEDQHRAHDDLSNPVPQNANAPEVLELDDDPVGFDRIDEMLMSREGALDMADDLGDIDMPVPQTTDLSDEVEVEIRSGTEEPEASNARTEPDADFGERDRAFR